ncbi:hypothetical protein [Streptomyces sp. NPDC059828]|uniref:hypothetical protein n=1 Tax=Streptomyces sp. NPDC059828 TaxID=3346965 RepID=UPI003647617D
MRLRIIPVTFAALFSATGCVSVSGTPHSPVPSTAAAPAYAGTQASPGPAPGRPSVREELASTAPEQDSAPQQDGAEPGTAAAAPRQGAARQPGRVPARHEAQPASPRRTPAKARPPRLSAPQHTGRPYPGPRPGYGMGHLCEESDGVTDPTLTALCRETYRR